MIYPLLLGTMQCVIVWWNEFYFIFYSVHTFYSHLPLSYTITPHISIGPNDRLEIRWPVASDTISTVENHTSIRHRICTLSTGITGHVKLDDNLDRLGEYLVWHKPSMTADYQPFVDIKMKSSPHNAADTSSRIDDIVTYKHTHAHAQTHT